MSKTITARFEEKVNRAPGQGPHGDCHEWVGTMKSNGYGTFYFLGQTENAHRVAYFLATGDWPGELCVLHSCDHRPCVNPEHLSLGTQLDNMADKVAKGRHPHGATSAGAKLTAEQAEEIRQLRGMESQSITAARYGVVQGAISRIQLGKAYVVGGDPTAQRDHWIRMFNRLDAAISHHAKTDRFKDDHDEALYAARDRILKDASSISLPQVKP